LKLPLSAVFVLLAYIVAITAFGTWLGRRHSGGVRGYFLGGKSVPWWAIASCIVATETSTLTFIGAPGTSYTGNFSFLQLVFGYVLGRLFVSFFFLPAYFRGEIFTSYEILQRRFGGAVRATSSGIFLLSRTLGDGIRLHAAALVLSVAAGINEWWCILALGLAMILYTEEGGVIATIWTDAIQLLVYLFGALICLVAVAHALPGGVLGALQKAGAAGKLDFINAAFDLREPYTLWAGVVGGMFLTIATHGTDHYLVQRFLVAKSEKDAQVGLVLSGFLVFAQFVLFLILGILLWSFYEGRKFARADEILPTFVSDQLPGVFTGLILAAIVAAALSPSLNSMASATLRDFYVPYVDPGISEEKQLRLAKGFTVFWGVLQIAVAGLARNVESALQAGLAALGYASGPTVGAFALGLFTRSANTTGTMMGMLIGLLVSLSVGLLSPQIFGVPGVAWTWNVFVGAVVTFAVGVAVSAFTREEAKASPTEPAQ
jgi:SSS family solute:Na+ symporter